MKYLKLFFALIILPCSGFTQSNSATITFNIKNSVPQTLKIYAYKNGSSYLQDSVIFKGGTEEHIKVVIPIEQNEKELNFRFSKKYGFMIMPILMKGENLVINSDFSELRKIWYRTSFSGSERTQEKQDFAMSVTNISKQYNAVNDKYKEALMANSADTAILKHALDSIDAARKTDSHNRGMATNSPSILTYALVGTSIGHYRFTDAEYKIFEEKFKNDPYALKTIAQYKNKSSANNNVVFKKNNGVDLNTYLANFTLTSADGKLISLSQFKGKYVLVDVWASWCAPCRAESPYLKDALSRFGAKNFAIVSVSIDEDHMKWKKAIAQDSTQKFIHLIDNKGWKAEVIKSYKITGIPSNFLLAPDGKVIDEDLRGKDMIVKLHNLLEKPGISK